MLRVSWFQNPANHGGWSKSMQQVECQGCGARGPIAKTEEEAAVLWNQRTGTERKR